MLSDIPCNLLIQIGISESKVISSRTCFRQIAKNAESILNSSVKFAMILKLIQIGISEDEHCIGCANSLCSVFFYDPQEHRLLSRFRLISAKAFEQW